MAVPKQGSMELGAKIKSPKTQIETQNWCQFLSSSFHTICLRISKYKLNPGKRSNKPDPDDENITRTQCLACCGARGGRTIQEHPLVASIPIALLLEFVIIHVTGVVRRPLLLVASCFVASPWMVRSIRSNIGCDFWSSRTRFISCRNCSGWSPNLAPLAALVSVQRIVQNLAAPPLWKYQKRASRDFFNGWPMLQKLRWCEMYHLFSWSAPVAFPRVALETSRDELPPAICRWQD